MLDMSPSCLWHKRWLAHVHRCWRREPRPQRASTDGFLIPRNSPDLFNRGLEEWNTMFWDARVAVSAGYFDSLRAADCQMGSTVFSQFKRCSLRPRDMKCVARSETTKSVTSQTTTSSASGKASQPASFASMDT